MTSGRFPDGAIVRQSPDTCPSNPHQTVQELPRLVVRLLLDKPRVTALSHACSLSIMLLRTI